MKTDILLVVRLTAETKEEAMRMPSAHAAMADTLQSNIGPGKALELPAETQVRFRLIPGVWET